MAENRINKDEIIDLPGLIKDLNETIIALEKLSKTLGQDLTQSARAAREALNAADATTKKGQTTIKKSVEITNRLTREQKELIIQQEKLGRAKREFRKQTKLDIAAAGSQKGSINSLKAEINKLSTQYDKMGQGATGASTRIKKLKQELLKLQNQTRANTGFAKKMAGSWKTAGKQLLTMTGLAGGATMAVRGLFNVIKKGFKTSWKFETAMSNVKAITGATGKEFDKLTRSAVSLGGSTKFTASEVAGLQKEYAKLGFATSEILSITSATLDLAAATGSDLVTSATIAGATLRQFSLSSFEMARVVDVMAAAFSSSALDITKWETSMQNAGPVAAAVGEDIESTAAKLAILANNGLDASISGTSLRNIFLELEKRGLTWNEAMAKIQNSQNKATTSLELFGKRGAVAGLILADNTVALEDMDVALRDVDGSAKDMADTMIDNVEGAITILNSSWEGFIIRTNESNGALKRVILTLADFVKSINSYGKPAIDSLFDERKIESWGDRFKVFSDAGKGFFLSFSAATGISNKRTQSYFDEITQGLNNERDAREKLLKTQADIDAKKKAADDKRNAADQAYVDELDRINEEAAKKEEKRITALLSKREKVSLDFQKNRKDALKEAEDELIKVRGDALTEGNNNELAAMQQQSVDEIAIAQATADAIAEINKEEKAERNQERLEDLALGLEIALQAANSLASIFEAQKQRELSAAGDNAEARAQIEAKYRKKQQAVAISQAVLNGALGITKTYAEYGFSPVGIAAAALLAATTAAQVAVISSQKFAKGGFGVLGGNMHVSGGTHIPGIGEAEKGEAVGIISRRATSNYGADMLEGVFKTIENGSFYDVWGTANRQISINAPIDPYTRKMYEHMINTPSYYIDSNGATVEVLNGQKRVINPISKN